MSAANPPRVQLDDLAQAILANGCGVPCLHPEAWLDVMIDGIRRGTITVYANGDLEIDGWWGPDQAGRVLSAVTVIGAALVVEP